MEISFGEFDENFDESTSASVYDQIYDNDFQECVDDAPRCEHFDVIVKDGMEFCTQCGQGTTIMEYDTKSYAYSRKSSAKNKTGDVFKKFAPHIPVNIREEVENRFQKIISSKNGKTESSVRKSNKTGLIAVCTYWVCLELSQIYKNEDMIIDPECAREMFGLSSNDYNDSNKKYCESYKDHMRSLKVPQFTFEMLLKIKLKQLDMTEPHHFTSIVKIYNYLKDVKKVQLVINSRYYSLVYGFIYYYYVEIYFSETKNKKITKKEFFKKCDISDMTITKIYKQIVLTYPKNLLI